MPQAYRDKILSIVWKVVQFTNVICLFCFLLQDVPHLGRLKDRFISLFIFELKDTNTEFESAPPTPFKR